MDILRQFAAVGLVLGLLLLVSRRLRPGSALFSSLVRKRQEDEQRLRIGDRVRLTPQHSLHMVSAGSRTWLVGCHTGGTVMLADLTGDSQCNSNKESK